MKQTNFRFLLSLIPKIPHYNICKYSKSRKKLPNSKHFWSQVFCKGSHLYWLVVAKQDRLKVSICSLLDGELIKSGVLPSAAQPHCLPPAALYVPKGPVPIWSSLFYLIFLSRTCSYGKCLSLLTSSPYPFSVPTAPHPFLTYCFYILCISTFFMKFFSYHCTGSSLRSGTGA
jgi:hypothetical protein